MERWNNKIEYLKYLEIRLGVKLKELREVRIIQANGTYKNSQDEVLKVEHQLIGEIQVLRHLMNQII